MISVPHAPEYAQGFSLERPGILHPMAVGAERDFAPRCGVFVAGRTGAVISSSACRHRAPAGSLAAGA